MVIKKEAKLVEIDYPTIGFIVRNTCTHTFIYNYLKWKWTYSTESILVFPKPMMSRFFKAMSMLTALFPLGTSRDCTLSGSIVNSP